jgi:hypothetical protein
MGSWGPGLFSDDTACDIRDAYREHVAEGLSGPAATDRLIKDWELSVAGLSATDPSDLVEEAIFWLSLAETQWKSGRLEDRVKKQALRAFESGAATTLWAQQLEPEFSGEAPKRIKAIAKTIERLQSPQPAEKKIRKQSVPKPVGEPGELLAYQLRTDEYVLLNVLDSGHTFIVLDWIGRTIPDEKTLKKLKQRQRLGGTYPISTWNNARELPKDRIVRLPIRRNLRNKEMATSHCFWKEFDTILADDYGFRSAADVRPPFHTGCCTFSLAIWDSLNVITNSEAHELFAESLKHQTRPKRTKPGRKLQRCINKLKREFPFDRDADSCPWSSNFSADEGFVLLGIEEEFEDSVPRQVRKLAREHGLYCYDPQTRRLYKPATNDLR